MAITPPAAFWLVIPLTTTIAASGVRNATFEEAEAEAVKTTAATGIQTIICGATHYVDAESFTAAINSTIVTAI